MGELQGVLEASPDAVVVVDEEGVIRQANRNVTDVLGYEPQDLEGTDVEDFLLEEGEERLEFRQEYIADPEPRPMGSELDLYARREDGTTIPVEISLGPVERDGDIYVVVTVSDISARKQRERELRASEERYRQLLELSPAPIVIYDAEGVLQYANEAAADLMNVDSPEDLVGTEALELVHPEERDEARERMRKQLEEGEPTARIERNLRTPDGEVRHAILSAAAIQYEDESAVQVVVNDITDRKERERELERQNERLEEFASIVSHDIRNPLNVADARLELAMEECDSDHLEAAARAHDRIESLLADLLTLAREGETVPETDPVALGTLAEDCWATVETGAATLRVESDCRLYADSSRFRELLENLIRNAVEHGSTSPGSQTDDALTRGSTDARSGTDDAAERESTPPPSQAEESAAEDGGEDVTVTVGTLEDGFYVADDGPGIPEADREDVFESGYSTKDTGTGLGLAIVDQVVDAHDWEITVTDSDEGGARFEVTDVEFV